MTFLAWAVCIYFGVMYIVKNLVKQEQNPVHLDKTF